MAVSTLQAVSAFVPGSTGIVRVMGDTLHSCRILLQDLERTCCFSNSERGSHLCDPEDQSSTCREEGWSVEDRPQGLCTLTLSHFQHRDQGTYSFIFPANFEDNQKIEVLMKEDDKNLLPVALLLTAFLLLLMFTLLLCYKLYRTHRPSSWPDYLHTFCCIKPTKENVDLLLPKHLEASTQTNTDDGPSSFLSNIWTNIVEPRNKRSTSPSLGLNTENTKSTALSDSGKSKCKDLCVGNIPSPPPIHPTIRRCEEDPCHCQLECSPTQDHLDRLLTSNTFNTFATRSFETCQSDQELIKRMEHSLCNLALNSAKNGTCKTKDWDNELVPDINIKMPKVFKVLQMAHNVKLQITHNAKSKDKEEETMILTNNHNKEVKFKDEKKPYEKDENKTDEKEA